MKKFITLAVIMTAALLFTSLAFAGDIGNNNTASGAVSDSAAATYIGDIGSNNTNQGAKTKRFFLNSGEINYPGMPGRFDAPPERHGYMNVLKVKDMLEYDEEGLTTAHQMTILKSKSGGKRVLVRPKFGKVRKEDRLDLDAPMSVVYTKQANMRSVGTITILSDSKGAISPDVFASAQVEAWKLGGTMLHVKAEGFQRQVHTFGAGIGFSWTGTTISGGQTSAATGVMGAGASWGEAGYYDHPFIIVHVLIPDTKKVVD